MFSLAPSPVDRLIAAKADGRAGSGGEPDAAERAPVVRVGVGSGKASYVRWPQKYLTASLRSRAEKRAAIVTSAVVPNDGFPVGAFVVVVVSVVRAAKTSGGVVVDEQYFIRYS